MERPCNPSPVSKGLSLSPGELVTRVRVRQPEQDIYLLLKWQGVGND